MEYKESPSRKEVLNALRAERKQHIARAASLMKTQKKEIKAITRFLEGGDATIPEIAMGAGMPPEKTLWYMATLKKYGRIAEGPKDGAFFKYSLIPASNANSPKTAEGGI